MTSIHEAVPPEGPFAFPLDDAKLPQRAGVGRARERRGLRGDAPRRARRGRQRRQPRRRELRPAAARVLPRREREPGAEGDRSRRPRREARGRGQALGARAGRHAVAAPARPRAAGDRGRTGRLPARRARQRRAARPARRRRGRRARRRARDRRPAARRPSTRSGDVVCFESEAQNLVGTEDKHMAGPDVFCHDFSNARDVRREPLPACRRRASSALRRSDPARGRPRDRALRRGRAAPHARVCYESPGHESRDGRLQQRQRRVPARPLQLRHDPAQHRRTTASRSRPLRTPATSPRAETSPRSRAAAGSTRSGSSAQSPATCGVGPVASEPAARRRPHRGQRRRRRARASASDASRATAAWSRSRS